MLHIEKTLPTTLPPMERAVDLLQKALSLFPQLKEIADSKKQIRAIRNVLSCFNQEMNPICEALGRTMDAVLQEAASQLSSEDQKKYSEMVRFIQKNREKLFQESPISEKVRSVSRRSLIRC